jgi:hypothetical protein
MIPRLTLAILMAAAARGEILDRVAVTVGKEVITESDVIRDLRVSAFLDQKPVDLSPAQKRKAADRLVDQLLILQEAAVAHLPLAAAEDAEPLLAQVKAPYATEAGYRAALARYRITEQELADHLLAGLRGLRFTDLRFRPEVQLSEEDLREFYNTLPQPAPSFEESRDEVEKLLTGQRVLQALDRWLGMTRTEMQILYREQVFK